MRKDLRFASILLGHLIVASAARSEASAWSFSASAYGYFLADDSDYLQPSFTADRRKLHLEARYNYEDLHAGSVWVGYNLDAGDEIGFELTPMLGLVTGSIEGIAPGFYAALAWKWLEVSAEGEYVFDREAHEDSFFYAWSELTISPVGWLRAGMVDQRTHPYQGFSESQRGILVGFYIANAAVAAHVFSPGDAEPSYVVSMSVEF